jgi:hypothetical protein
VDTGLPAENATNKENLEHDPIQLDWVNALVARIGDRAHIADAVRD